MNDMAEIVREASRWYGLDAGLKPEPLGAGGHLFAVGDRVLKHHWFLTDDRAPVLGAVLSDLAECGVHPRLDRDSEGNVLARINGGWFSCMEVLESAKPPVAEDALQAAQVLAEAHAVLARHGQGTVLRSPMWADDAAIARELESAGEHALALHVRGASELQGLTTQLVHNDLHSGNFLRSSGRLYLLDFDSFSTNPLIGDVYFCGLRLAGARGVMGFAGAYTEAARLPAKDMDAGWAVLLADLARKIAFIGRRERAGDATFIKDREKYLGFVRACEVAAGGRA